MNLNNRIAINPAICHSKLTIRGLFDYPVNTTSALFSVGLMLEETIDDYEHLEREDLLALFGKK